MNRTELIHYYSQECESKALRGNTLWLLWKHGEKYSIACRILFNKSQHEWGGIRENEESGFSKLTCPENYINMTPVVDEEWRKKVLDRHKKKRETKTKLREMFRKSKEENKILKVKTLIGFPELTIEEIYPSIVGRHPKTELLYRIPLLDVREITQHEKEIK